MDSPKNTYVEIVDRDFNDLTNPPKTSFTINRYSKTISGGCKEAHLTAYGDQSELWAIANMLRYGLYIYNQRGDPLWWGYIAEVKIRIGNLVFGVSLDTMSNRIAVVYTSFGTRETTAFAEDDYSIGTYGTKELLSVVSDATREEALQRRDSDLEAKKLPIPTVEFEAQSEGSFSANIICRGFYDTLEWKYYSQEKGLVEHSSNGVGQQNLGVILSSACLTFDSGTDKINDWAEGLNGFKKGSIISITGTSSNNGKKVVSQGSTAGCSITVEGGVSDETAASTTIVSASQIAQRFSQSSGSDWDASSIHVRVQPSGSPSDDLVVSLYSAGIIDPASPSPLSELITGSYAGSDMVESMVWTEIPLSASVTIENSLNYYVSLYRSGTPSTASAYYKIDMDEGLGYGDGEFIIKTSNGWIPRSTDADMLFKVVGTQPVVDQIKEIGNTSGQFFENSLSDVVSACAPETIQYRDGETTALVEINKLLKVGSKSNLRLLAEVTSHRTLLITEQPDKNNIDNQYKMALDGTITSSKGKAVPNTECPVGIWVEIDQFVPATFDQSYLANPGKFFIEECEYYVQSDRIVPRSLDTSNVWELGKIKDG